MQTKAYHARRICSANPHIGDSTVELHENYPDIPQPPDSTHKIFFSSPFEVKDVNHAPACTQLAPACLSCDAAMDMVERVLPNDS